MPRKSAVIHVSLPRVLLQHLDEAANEECMNRSEFIRQALHQRLLLVLERRADMAWAAMNTDVPTEEMLYDMLRIRAGQRSMRVWAREQRRTRSKQ